MVKAKKMGKDNAKCYQNDEVKTPSVKKMKNDMGAMNKGMKKKK